MRFFKGVYPRQKRFLNDGSYIQLEDVGSDQGVFKASNDVILREVDSMIREQRGGMEEITEAAYEELKKNATPSPTPFREEFRMGVGLTRNNQRVSEAPLFPAKPVALREPPAPAVGGNQESPAQAPTVNIDRPRATRS